jgi:Rrf2 family protein
LSGPEREMKVSTKGQYGVAFMVDLALHYDQGPVSLGEVARRQGISEKYLWQVLNPLKAAGLIVSTRGSRGGYVLARRLEEINVRDIVSTLEGEPFLGGAVSSPDPDARAQSWVVHAMWKQVEDRLAAALESVTLKDLVDRQRARAEASVPNYAI